MQPVQAFGGQRRDVNGCDPCRWGGVTTRMAVQFLEFQLQALDRSGEGGMYRVPEMLCFLACHCPAMALLEQE